METRVLAVERIFDYRALMPALIDEPIAAETTVTGRPAAITWRGTRYPVRVLVAWDAQVYRVAATVNGGPAIAELARRDEGWWLRYWWTS
jgi:hypothetical protein